jgi:hypothetical protein
MNTEYIGRTSRHRYHQGVSLQLHLLPARRTGTFERALMREAFGGFLEECEPDRWRLTYDAKNTCDILLKPSAGSSNALKSLCVDRPCADMRLWDALVDILRNAPVVLVCPGCPPIVGDRSVADEILTKDLGEPVCVANGSELRARVGGE